MNIWIFLAGLNGAVAVAAGAYGWHMLSDTPDIRDIFMMGSQYQMWHGFALLGVGLMQHHRPCRAFSIAGGLFQVGLVLFSGTLYSFALLSVVPLEGAAPLGGGLLLVAWLIVAVQGARSLRIAKP